MDRKLIVKTEKIEQEVLDVLVKNNTHINEVVTQIGSLHIRRRELEEELTNLDTRVMELEDSFKESNTEITTTLRKLESKYSNGKIDLNKGSVTYTVEDVDNQ